MGIVAVLTAFRRPGCQLAIGISGVLPKKNAALKFGDVFVTFGDSQSTCYSEQEQKHQASVHVTLDDIGGSSGLRSVIQVR